MFNTFPGSGRVVKLATKEADYWKSLKIEDSDIEALFDLFEDGNPHTTEELVRVIVASRVRDELKRIGEGLKKGIIYQPKSDYSVGDEIAFPSLNYRRGKVVGKRPGVNPEYGKFDVIQVEFPDTGETLEFASSFPLPHKLNMEGELDGAMPSVSTDEILDEHGAVIARRVEEEIQENYPGEFVRFNGKWMLADALVPFNEGHLNIAEALIEINGKPTPASELLPQLDIQSDASEEAMLFSLNLALERDERFVNAGSEDEPKWFLWRLLPDAARETPMWLEYSPIPMPRAIPNVDLTQITVQIADEWSELLENLPDEGDTVRVTVVVPYHHWRAGTLPLNVWVKKLVGTGGGRVEPVRFADTRRGKRFTGWVLAEGRYIAGLKEWFEERQIPIGGVVILERNPDDPEEILIDARTRRPKREWVKEPVVEGDALTFRVNQESISSEFDEHMLFGKGDFEAVDSLRQTVGSANIHELVRRLFPELAKIKGTVHAKTLYQAVNMLRRCPPEPIFQVLVSDSSFVDSGDGFWISKGDL